MRRLRSLLASLLGSTSVFFFATACAFLPRPVETPIPMQVHGDVDTAEEVFVLLPGVFDSMESFEESGFVPIAVEATSGRRDSVFVAVDAHLGYYKERSIHAHLKDDVLQQFAGKKITVVGISLGGFGALVTARRHPDLFDRIVLVAPFLGWPNIVEAIKADPEGSPEDKVDAEFRAIWAWLKDGNGEIPVTLLYGEDDKFRKTYDHLATLAPNVDFRGTEGAHDWPTWNSLWATWLADDLGVNTLAANRLSANGR